MDPKLIININDLGWHGKTFKTNSNRKNIGNVEAFLNNVDGISS
jgi:hypothetical protein